MSLSFFSVQCRLWKGQTLRPSCLRVSVVTDCFARHEALHAVLVQIVHYRRQLRRVEIRCSCARVEIGQTEVDLSQRRRRGSSRQSLARARQGGCARRGTRRTASAPDCTATCS